MPDDDRAAYIRALVAHRCPEIEPADLATLATLTQAVTTPVKMLPEEISRDILEVLDLMLGRLDELADAVGANDDDANQGSHER
jgi:hypothetical protein